MKKFDAKIVFVKLTGFLTESFSDDCIKLIMVDRAYFVKSILSRAFIGFFYFCNLWEVLNKLYILPSFISVCLQ